MSSSQSVSQPVRGMLIMAACMIVLPVMDAIAKYMGMRACPPVR